MSHTPITVAVIDDKQEIRDVVGDMLRADPGINLVGTAADTTSGVELAARERPDVLLMDVRIPPHGGPRASVEALELSPGTRIVAYSAYQDRASVMEMLQAGAVAYICKSAKAEEILDAVHRAAQGQSTLSPEISAQVVHEVATHLKREGDENERQASMRGAVRTAIASPETMTMVYQPIVDIHTGALAGVEALARFALRPERPPNQWFDSAWKLGLGPELELEAVARGLHAVRQLVGPTYVSVNLSPAAICSEGFPAALDGHPRQRVVLEVTEHAAVDDYESLAAALKEPRSHGLRLAVDDAGAGYASLRHILRLEPDFIKIDLDLTRGIEADRRRRALASALISFAGEIDAQVVAEGIETAAEVEALKELGVRWGQGYLLGRPAPLRAAVKP